MAKNTEEKIVKIIADGKQAEASINQITRAVSALNRERNKEAAGSDRYKELTKDLTTMNKKLGDARSEVKSLNGASKDFGSSWKGIATGILGADIIGSIGSAFKSIAGSIFNTSKEFQRFESVLTNSLGSQKAAKDALQEIQMFASKTPFTIDGLTNSYIKLVNRGFKPTTAEMTKLGDLSSTLGKDFDQLVEAMLDAQTGEFERLKEFGIRASKSGDQVKFSFRGVTTETKFTEEAIRNYIMSLGELEGVQGSMAAISENWGGKLSNIEDKLTITAQQMGERFKPAIDEAMKSVSGLVTVLGDWIAVPLSEKLEQERTDLAMTELKIIDVNTSNSDRIKLINELKIQYPEYLGNINAETISNGELSLAISKVNEGLVNKIIIQKKQEEIDKQIANAADKRLVLLEKEAKVREIIANSGVKIPAGLNLIQQAQVVMSKLGNDYEGLETKVGVLQFRMKDFNQEVSLANKLSAEKSSLMKELGIDTKSYIADLGGEKNAQIEAYKANKKANEERAKEAALKNAKSKKVDPNAPRPGVDATTESNLGVSGFVQMQVASALDMLQVEDEINAVGIEKTKTAADLKMAILGDFEAKKRELQINAAKQLGNDIENMAFTLMEKEVQAKYSTLLSGLEKQRQAELDNKNLTEEQKASINEFYDAKSRAIKNEQARKEKELALFRIAIDTSVAAVKAFSDDPSGILSALIIAQGLTQAALVAGKEVPQFYAGGVTGAQDGRSYNPQNVGSFAGGGPVNVASMGLIGERGPELVIPNWMYSSPRMASTMMALESMISGGRAFADGGPTTGGGAKGFDDAELKQLLKYNAATMARLNSMLDNGIIANVNWDQVGYDKYLGRREKVKQISEL